jgi:hypothetical protein
LFSGIAPSYKYSVVTGYCSYCAKQRQVSEQFWFLCGICERIVKSYAAEQAATRFLLDWWRGVSRTDTFAGSIKFQRTDPVSRMSFEEHQRWKQSPHESKPDFTGVELSTDSKTFAIEMKTGRSSIAKMSAFQLDVSDCDDILSFVRELGIPSYVFHVQVVEEYLPPTFRKVALNAWWASVFDMEAAFKEVRMRQREQRPAAFFKKTAFRTLDRFLVHLKSEEIDTMKAELETRLPRLYIMPTPSRSRRVP